MKGNIPNHANKPGVRHASFGQPQLTPEQQAVQAARMALARREQIAVTLLAGWVPGLDFAQAIDDDAIIERAFVLAEKVMKVSTGRDLSAFQQPKPEAANDAPPADQSEKNFDNPK